MEFYQYPQLQYYQLQLQAPLIFVIYYYFDASYEIELQPSGISWTKATIELATVPSYTKQFLGNSLTVNRIALHKLHPI